MQGAEEREQRTGQDGVWKEPRRGGTETEGERRRKKEEGKALGKKWSRQGTERSTIDALRRAKS